MNHNLLARFILAFIMGSALLAGGCSNAETGETSSTTTVTSTTPQSTSQSVGSDAWSHVGTHAWEPTTPSGATAADTMPSSTDYGAEAARVSGGSAVADAWNGVSGNAQRMTSAMFVEQASMANFAELQLGNLAMQKSSSAAVKQYAQHLLDDHGQAGAKLEQLASQNGQTLATRMDAQDQQTYDQLSSLQGLSFDRAFITAMVQDHQKAVNIFEQASRELPAGALERFASSTLPKLQQHLSHAQQLDQQISTAGDDTSR